MICVAVCLHHLTGCLLVICVYRHLCADGHHHFHFCFWHHGVAGLESDAVTFRIFHLWQFSYFVNRILKLLTLVTVLIILAPFLIRLDTVICNFTHTLINFVHIENPFA